MARVLVLGAQGVLGAALADALEEDGHEVARAGRRPGAGIVLVDLERPETLRAAAAGADLVVNPILTPGLVPERVLLRAGGRLLSVASLSLADRRALAAEGGGPGLAVVHAGLNPGLVTIALAELLRLHPGATRVDVAATVPPLRSMRPLAYAYARPFLRARTPRPTTTVPFPPPVGPRRALELGRGEEGWLGEVGTGRDARVWMALHERGANAALLLANRLGLLGRLPGVALPAHRGALPTEPKADLALAAGGGRRLVATVRGRGDYRTAAAATAAMAARLLARGNERGLHGAEAFFSLAELLPALARRGVSVAVADAPRKPLDPPGGA